MPQGRRKQPFSNKQKKQQLQAKREQKKTRVQHQGPTTTTFIRNKKSLVSDDGDIEDELDEEIQSGEAGDTIELLTGDVASTSNDPLHLRIHAINSQRNLSGNRDVNRYALQFFQESDQEIRERKERAQKPFKVLDAKEGLACSVEDMFGEAVDEPESGIPITDLDMPKRPPWSADMTPQELNSLEHKYFNNYLNQLFAKADGTGEGNNKSLSYFDLNLETWRQLWRVIEMSDIILLVADIRHPIFHFPPSLYHYVVDEMGKEMILMLNKIDLVEASLVVAWRDYLTQRFPKLNILEFASYAGMRVRSSSRKRVGKLRMAVRGASALETMIEKIVDGQVDLSTWRAKIETELKETENNGDDDNDSYYESDDEEFSGGKPFAKKNKGTSQVQLENRAETVVIEKADTTYYKQEGRYKDGIVTIGCVGHPNVGKSSLLNALYGKKVVSVSRTPGHTKHFQTIFLTDNVRLCDCPGLVFPSRAPKALQVLMGCYPISQLREPYTAVGYLAQRVNLVRLLRLQHPEGDTETTWTAYDICESWAEKRGFLTARTARPDVYRAANHLLRMALDGRTICLAFQPPIYLEQPIEAWESHERYQEVVAIQNRQLVEEQLNKNLMWESHNQGYVDSHASSVEADLDDDDDSDGSGSGNGLGSNISSRFAFIELDDVEA